MFRDVVWTDEKVNEVTKEQCTRLDTLNAWFSRMAPDFDSGPMGDAFDALKSLLEVAGAGADCQRVGETNDIWNCYERERFIRTLYEGVRLLREMRAETREFNTEIEPDAPIE